MSYDREAESAREEAPAPQPWRRNLVLFLLTVVSVMGVAALGSGTASLPPDPSLADYFRTAQVALSIPAGRLYAAQFTVSLLAILLAHEFGHYIAARIHRVDASLPYFIPMPFSPFGTMGAVIRMRGQIPTRRALMDIGASGPLAGLCLAIPIYCYGAAHSTIVPKSAEGVGELGEPLLVKLLDAVAGPPVPDGSTLLLSPFAFAAWAGFFVTMINLLPIGQLDGGHVAYSLLGKRQDRIARNLHRGLFFFFFGALVLRGALRLRSTGSLASFSSDVHSSTFWLVWFQMLAVIGTLAGQKRATQMMPLRVRLAPMLGIIFLPDMVDGPLGRLAWVAFAAVALVMIWLEVRRGVFKEHSLVNHPEVGDEKLDPVRSVIAVITLLFFVALFMPTPFNM